MSYNIGTIRKLIRSSLLEDELEPLCEDYFNKISDDVGSVGLNFSQRIDIIVDYVKKSDQRIERLLAAIKEINPDKYSVFEPDLQKTDEPEEFQPTINIPPHLPYLCDRSFQEDDLEKAFVEHRNHPQKQKYPLLCIIHGSETECHDSFIERISDAGVLQRLYKSEKKIEKVDRKELRFPPLRGRQRAFLSDLPRQLREEVEEFFASLPGVSNPLIIYYYIDTKDWRFGGRELIKTFVKFWNERAVSADRLQIVCLCVKYRTSGFFNWWYRRKCKKFLETLQEKKFSEFENLYSVLLTELQAVEKDDAEEWARSESVQPWWKAGRQELETEVRGIYARHCSTRRWKAKECIPMDKLAQELKELLRKRKNNF